MANPSKHLYEYAVLHRDKDDTTVVVEPATLLAVSAEVARNKAIRAVPEQYEDKLDELQVIVRLFQ